MSAHILNTPFTNITFEPEYKVSLWVGIGADGKSALCNYILDNPSLNPDYVFMGSNTLEVDSSKILIYDEDALVSTSVIEYIKTCNNPVVILAREIITSIKLHYKAIYNLIEQADGRLVTVRRYANYDHFIPNLNYLIEDSGTGFQYARYWLRDVETTNGNEGIAAKVKDQQVIADGCGIARVLDKILEKTNKVYLYNSFENALLKELQININTLTTFDLEETSFKTLLKLYKRYSKGGILHENLFALNIFRMQEHIGPDIVNIIGALVLFLSNNKDLKHCVLNSDHYSLPERQLIAIVENTNRATQSLINLYNQNYKERKQVNYKQLVIQYCEGHNISKGLTEVKYRNEFNCSEINYKEFYEWLKNSNGNI